MDTRGLRYLDYVDDISIHYAAVSIAGFTPTASTHEESKTSVATLIKSAHKELNLAPVYTLHHVGVWQGKAKEVKFSFSVPVCRGTCTATAHGGSSGEIHNGANKVIYTSKRMALDSSSGSE